MTKPKQSRTRVRLATAKELFAKGFSSRQIRDELVERFGISPRSAQRTMHHAEHELEREIDKRRRLLIARQSAKLDLAQQTALDRTKFFAHEGSVTDSRPDPNVGAFVDAVREQSKLLGIGGEQVLDRDEWAQAELILIQREAAVASASSNPGNGSNGSSTNGQSPLPYTPRNGSS